MHFVDHLMMGVADFRASAADWQSDHGLAAIEGLRFDEAPAFGNWAVPLGRTWIELVGVADEEAGRGDPRAQMFASVVSARDRLLGWALAPENLDAVAERLQLPVSDRHATRIATGERFTWRQVGFDETRVEYYLPFFIGWDHDVHTEMDLSTSEVANARAKPEEVTLKLTGDPGRLARWLGEIEAPISITHGTPSITATIATDRGQLTLR